MLRSFFGRILFLMQVQRHFFNNLLIWILKLAAVELFRIAGLGAGIAARLQYLSGI